jgi:hypothetical protein
MKTTIDGIFFNVDCTSEDLIKAVPDWLQIGNLVFVDPFVINEHFNAKDGVSKVIGLILEYYVLDIDSVKFTTKEELEELFYYEEWLTCILLVQGEILETDLGSIRKI